ncbi:hypothetical protein M1N42_03760 [Thermodesulfovibrionales bacterium]|nr:hypothetical protein [Thermodesulfovibrionales bacterium]
MKTAWANTSKTAARHSKGSFIDRREDPPVNLLYHATPLYRWIAFAVGVLLIAGATVIASLTEQLPWLGTKIETVRKADIDTGAFFYTDVYQVEEARARLRHSRDFPLIGPIGPPMNHLANDKDVYTPK